MSVVARVRNNVDLDVLLEDWEISSVLSSARKLHLPQLSFVDLYGVTTFNYLQVREIQEELRIIQAEGDSKVAISAMNLSDFSSKVFETSHRFLVFVGD